MSKLDILNSCIKNSKKVVLSDIIETLPGGSLKKNDVLDSGIYKVMNGGADFSGYYDEYNNEPNVITVSHWGSSAGYLHYHTERFWANNACWIFKSKDEKQYLTKYIYYYLKSIENKIMSKMTFGGATPNLSKPQFYNILVPSISIDKQIEIINFFDNFSSLSNNLKTEIDLRNDQLEYYKSKLLFNEKYTEVVLSDVAFYSKERINSIDVNEDNYISVENLLQKKAGKKKSSCVPTEGNLCGYKKEDILIGNIRPYLRKIWFANNDGGTNGDVLDIRVKDKSIILPKYLYYVLSSENFFEYDNSNSKGARMPRGDKEAVMKFKFYIPSIEIQVKIVDFLDNINCLINSDEYGLIKELTLRQKQLLFYSSILFKEELIVNE